MICAFFVLLVQSFSYLSISHFEKFLSINTSTLQSGASRITIRHSFSLVPMATHWFVPVVALLSCDIDWSQAFVLPSFTEDVKNVCNTCSTCSTAVLFPDNSVICLFVFICFICFPRKGFPLSVFSCYVSVFTISQNLEWPLMICAIRKFYKHRPTFFPSQFTMWLFCLYNRSIGISHQVIKVVDGLFIILHSQSFVEAVNSFCVLGCENWRHESVHSICKIQIVFGICVGDHEPWKTGTRKLIS